MKNTGKLIALVGPTATGKTEIAIQLAQLNNGEIISADSRLVYKDFNIGTAKPTAEELAIVPHYMIDIADPKETYTVGMYKKEANRIIKDILSRGKVPIIAGGTGFYIKALLGGLDIPEVAPDEEFRQGLKQLSKEDLYKILTDSDPETAKKLHPNDSYRIIRALEVQKALGKAMSKAQAISEPEYDVTYVGLTSDNRDFLYERINRRVDIMIKKGLIDEINNLINKYGKTLSLLKTLGYKEICDYLDGLVTLEESIEKIKKNTRNFAKRQLTWFRANKEINWYFIDKMSKDEIVGCIYAQK